MKERNFYKYFTDWHHQNWPHRSHHCMFLLVFLGYFFKYFIGNWWASPVAQTVKNPSAMREAWVQSLDWKNPLKEDMATLFSVLTLEDPQGRRSLAGYSPWRRKDMDTTEWLSIHTWGIDSFCNITSGTLQKKNHSWNMTLSFGLLITKKHINQLDGVQRKARKIIKRMKGVIY